MQSYELHEPAEGLGGLKCWLRARAAAGPWPPPHTYHLIKQVHGQLNYECI